MGDFEKLAGYIDELVAEKKKIDGSMSLVQAQKIAMLASCIQASMTAYCLKMNMKD